MLVALLVLFGFSGAAGTQDLQLLRDDSSARSFTFDRSVLGNIKGVDQVNMGVVPTAVSRNFALVAEVSMGIPAQSLRCLLDTGSSDLWLPSKRCTNCENERFFRADASYTFKPNIVQTVQGPRPEQVKVMYGSGEIVGYAVQDTLGFGSLQIRNQSFIIVEDAALPPRRSWDGICGLGWKALSKTDRPLYARIQEQGTRALFAFVPGRAGTAPHMMVGKMPQEQALRSGTLVWTKAETLGSEAGSLGGQRSFWIVSGGLAITKRTPVPARFLVDTGTNQVLLAPPKYYDAFMKSLLPAETFDRLCGHDPRAGNLVVCECSIAQETGLPPLRIYLGGRAFVLPVSDLFRKVPASDGGDLCLLQIQPNGMGPGALPDIADILGGLLGGLLGGSTRHGSTGSSGSSSKDPLAGILGGSAGGSSSSSSGEQTLGGLLGDLLGSNRVQVESSRRLQFQDPMEDIWMIGGVFLERFVTIFDFDEGRIGFAEPAGGVVPLATSRLNAVLPDKGSLQEALAAGRNTPPIIAICAVAAVAGTATLLGIALRMRSRRTLKGDGDTFQRSGYSEASIEDAELGDSIE